MSPSPRPGPRAPGRGDGAAEPVLADHAGTAGAAAGYLHLGLSGGLLATATQVLLPGSFSLGDGASQPPVAARPAHLLQFRHHRQRRLWRWAAGRCRGGVLLGRFIASEEVEMHEDEPLELE